MCRLRVMAATGVHRSATAADGYVTRALAAVDVLLVGCIGTCVGRVPLPTAPHRSDLRVYYCNRGRAHCKSVLRGMGLPVSMRQFRHVVAHADVLSAVTK